MIKLQNKRNSILRFFLQRYFVGSSRSEVYNPNDRTKASRFHRLFHLFELALESGQNFSPISMIDYHLEKKQIPIFLKHDVHDLCLDKLICFAKQESDLGIYGTYFFMIPNHPRTLRAYEFSRQLKCMHTLQDLGHEIGLHLDPFFLIHDTNKCLAEALYDVLTTFRQNDIEFKIGNMHGHVGFQYKDTNGYGTSFDLFDELGRQPDFPALKNVNNKVAEIIRKNRVKLSDFGIDIWADMPLWSKKHGFVATNFLSDNALGKTNKIRVVTRSQTDMQYYVSKSKPPGSITLPTEGVIISPQICADNLGFTLNNDEQILWGAQLIDELFSNALSISPLLILLHPEFYC